MKSFVSKDNTLEALMEIPEHRELLETKRREIEGFRVVHREEHTWDIGSVTINLVFKK